MKARIALTLIITACAMQHAYAQWLYDGTPLSIRGTAMGSGLQTDMAAQRLAFEQPVEINRIGVAVAQGLDPNGVGMRVSLVSNLYEPDETLLGAWQVHPVDGPIFAFAYFDTEPIRLDGLRWYYLIIAPGDEEFLGGIAYAYSGYPGLATKDDGATWFDTSAHGVRIGGTVIPEPMGALSLAGCLGGIAAVGRLGARKRKSR